MLLETVLIPSCTALLPLAHAWKKQVLKYLTGFHESIRIFLYFIHWKQKSQSINKKGAGTMSPIKPTEKEEEYFARLELEKKKTLAVEKTRALADEEKKKLKDLHYMHCPKCGSELVEITYKQVMIDKCPSCEGVWLDCGELNQVVTDQDSFLGGMLKIFKE